jgi:hypothetical protein
MIIVRAGLRGSPSSSKLTPVKGSINGPYEPSSQPNNRDVESGRQLGGRDASSVVVHIKRATEVLHDDLDRVSVRSFLMSCYPDTTPHRRMVIHRHPMREAGRRNCQSIPLNIRTHEMPHPHFRSALFSQHTSSACSSASISWHILCVLARCQPS